MRHRLVQLRGYCHFLVLFFATESAGAQAPNSGRWVCSRLDSIRRTPSVSATFANLYLGTTQSALSFFSTSDTAEQRLIGRFINRFALYFLEAARAYQNGDSVPNVWKTYYSDYNASPLRLALYGINAHINGDIWQAITTCIDSSEISRLKPSYKAFHHSLTSTLRTLQEQAIAENNSLRFFHQLSLGMDYWIAKRMLAVWRNRQFRLARAYFSRSPRFSNQLRRTARRKQRLDAMIRRWI